MFKYSRFAQFCTSFTLFNLTIASGLSLSPSYAAIVVSITPTVEQPTTVVMDSAVLIAAAANGKNSPQDIQVNLVSSSSSARSSTSNVATSDDDNDLTTLTTNGFNEVDARLDGKFDPQDEENAPDTARLDISVTAVPATSSAIASGGSNSAITSAITNNANQNSTSKTYRDAFGNLHSRPVVSTLALEEEAVNEASSACAISTQSPPSPPTVHHGTTSDLKIAVIYFSRSEQDESDLDNSYALPAAPAKPEALAELAEANQALALGTEPPANLDIDVLTGASVLYDEQKHRYGLIEYLARNISQQVHGDLYQLSRYKPYPHDHDALIDEVSSESNHRRTPQIKISPKFDPDQYDLVFVGYPVWWQDLPRPYYKFFNLFDLSGKTIIPFSSHTGNKSSQTCEIIQKKEPNAKVMCEHGLIIAHQDIPISGQELVNTWLHELDATIAPTIRQQTKQSLVLNGRNHSEATAPALSQDNYTICSSKSTAIVP